MLRKENIVIILVGAILLTLGVGYATYINPLGDNDRIHEKKVEDLLIQWELPVQYDTESINELTNITIKGTKEMMKDTEHLSPRVYGVVEAYEGEQFVNLEVDGLDGYIYELDQEQLTIQVTELELEPVKPKIVVQGKPEKKIKKIDLVEDIQGYFNSNTIRDFGEVKVVIQVDGLSENTTVTGEILIEDVNEAYMDSAIVDKEEVGVKVVVD